MRFRLLLGNYRIPAPWNYLSGFSKSTLREELARLDKHIAEYNK